MISIYDTRRTLALLSQSLTKNKRAMFTRFGDNDIMQMSGYDSKGAPLTADRTLGGNRTTFSKYLQSEMIEAFQIPDKDPTAKFTYMRGVSAKWKTERGMVDGVFKNFKYNRDLERRVLTFTRCKEFMNPIAFHYLCVFKNDKFEEFLRYHVRGRKILYIGNVAREDAAKVVGAIDYHVQTPQFDAYSKIDDWYKKVEYYLQNEPIDLVIPSCGQASRIVTKRMWKAGYEVQSLDMGSLFDAVADVPSRTWIKEVGQIVRGYYK